MPVQSKVTIPPGGEKRPSGGIFASADSGEKPHKALLDEHTKSRANKKVKVGGGKTLTR